MMDSAGSLSKVEERPKNCFDVFHEHPTDGTTRHLSFPGCFLTKITRLVLAELRRYFNNGKLLSCARESAEVL